MTFFDSLPVGHPSSMVFTSSHLNRASELRENADWQQAALENPASRCIVICRDTPVLGFDGHHLDALFDPEAAKKLGPVTDSLFLGLDGEIPYFGLQLDAALFETLKERPDLKLIDMRSVAMQGLFTPGQQSAIGTAKAMFFWHNRHRFCAHCGTASVMASSGWKRVCQACKVEHFPRTDPVVIMLAIAGDRCLMGRNAAFPDGRYSCLAGFMEPGETIEDATRREIFEETSIQTGRVRYLTAQPWPFPGSLMIGCLAEATSFDIKIDPAELADARWFSREETRQIMAGTHPEGITAPPKMAIANHIMQIFVNGEKAYG
jgi:NAD+ diphosphatase